MAWRQSSNNLTGCQSGVDLQMWIYEQNENQWMLVLWKETLSYCYSVIEQFGSSSLGLLHHQSFQRLESIWDTCPEQWIRLEDSKSLPILWFYSMILSLPLRGESLALLQTMLDLSITLTFLFKAARNRCAEIEAVLNKELDLWSSVPKGGFWSYLMSFVSFEYWYIEGHQKDPLYCYFSAMEHLDLLPELVCWYLQLIITTRSSLAFQKTKTQPKSLFNSTKCHSINQINASYSTKKR